MVRGSVDTKATAAALAKITKQLPFAMSRTTNGLALAAQKRVRDDMGKTFTLRRPDFIKSSVRVELGDKQNPTAAVGIPPRPRSGIDEVMALHERGGIERPDTGRHLAQPLAARPTPSAVTPPSKWPSKLKRSFKVTTDSGDEFILQRSGPRKGKRKRSRKVKLNTTGPGQSPRRDPKLKIMYLLRDEVPVAPRLGFVETCLEVARTQSREIFAKELANAIRTAK